MQELYQTIHHWDYMRIKCDNGELESDNGGDDNECDLDILNLVPSIVAAADDSGDACSACIYQGTDNLGCASVITGSDISKHYVCLTGGYTDMVIDCVYDIGQQYNAKLCDNNVMSESGSDNEDFEDFEDDDGTFHFGP